MAAVEMNDGFFWGYFWGQVPDLTPDQVRDLVPDLSPKGMKRNQQGFTLMELMIVVAIVAILAAIALPAYQNSVTKTWRNKAASCLTEMSQTMERRFTGAMSYEGPTAAPAQLPPNTCTTDDGMATYYAFSFTADPTATAFTLQAVPQGGQAARDGQCATLTINQAGTRTASGTGGAAMCW